MNLDHAVAAQPINLTCTSCGHNFPKALGEVERDGQATCPVCWETSQLDQAGRERIAAFKKEIAQHIADAGKDLSGFLQDLNRRK